VIHKVCVINIKPIDKGWFILKKIILKKIIKDKIVNCIIIRK
jgi:hypothetical protein